MRYWITLLSFLFPFLLQAQTLPETEANLSALFGQLKSMPPKEEVLQLHEQIKTSLQKALQQPESFHYPFDSLNFLGKIYSDDNLIRIYTWNVPFHDGTFTYGCIIQQQQDNKLTTFNINEAYKPTLNRYVAPNNWYGALYYRAVPVTHKKNTYYTLLGWAGNDGITNIKMIDVLSFNEKGGARLGMPVFRKKNNTFYRVIFEYTAQATMTLDFDKKSKQIIFDHLSPSSNKYEGIYSHYGPDFTYDSFLLKKGEWVFKEDVDVRNELY